MYNPSSALDEINRLKLYQVGNKLMI